MWCDSIYQCFSHIQINKFSQIAIIITMLSQILINKFSHIAIMITTYALLHNTERKLCRDLS